MQNAAFRRGCTNIFGGCMARNNGHYVIGTLVCKNIVLNIFVFAVRMVPQFCNPSKKFSSYKSPLRTPTG